MNDAVEKGRKGEGRERKEVKVDVLKKRKGKKKKHKINNKRKKCSSQSKLVNKYIKQTQ